MPSTTAKAPHHSRPARPAASRCLDAGRLAVATLLLTVGLQGAATADAPLRWKFKTGETVRYSLVQKTETTMKLPDGRTGGSKVSQDSDIHWTVNSVSPEGVAEMTQTIDRVRVRMDSVPGQPPFEFDSASKDPAPEGPVAAQLVPIFRALAGLECTLMMDARGEIRDVRIADKVVESLQKSFQGGLGNLFTKESLKNMVGQSSLVLPEEAVAKGKSWKEQSKIPAAQLGTMVTDKTYTFEGPEAADASRVRIDLTSKTSLEPDANAQIEFAMKNQDGKGRFVFDAAKGRIISSHVDITMTQSIKAQGQELEQTIVNKIEMKLAPEPSAAK
ncbi:MAG: DUF6263 family protein [Paludisphaera borealis]|uniref:DUF6263 family protein n=1 Tax=Paludisphaera borealis TaxID=1387353 RepID=UPI00283D6E5F|nr:DUF6263 family protein [Paludisphaera borealis]MDR3620133.1 DUF6263 family protein [Paludisphaera borealis]